ncbi:MAG: M81 family metallopeptidase [Chloroflexi bacterium]|nr:M81 family metallopeptidase [Chloroflexota bacterium]
MSRFAVGGFLHETNTFAPGKTGFTDFTLVTGDDSGLKTGAEILEFRKREMNVGPSGFIRKAEASGHEVVPLVWTSAQPSGTVTDEAFNRIMDLLLAALAANGPYDGVFLDLHGAMVVESYEDPETEIGRRVRQVIRDTPLVAALDLHGNITQECVDVFSGLVGYRTYPHVDIYETGERCAVMLDYLVQHPPLKKAFRKLPILLAPSMMSTMTEPCLSIYPVLEGLEKDAGVFSATIMHGFLPSDIAQVGPSVWAYAADQQDADRAADALEKALLDHEAELKLNLLQPDEAVRQAIQKSAHTEKPVILADVQDNPGGGGTSDTVWILEALVRQNAPDTALGLMYDPAAAAVAHAAGEGAQITLDLGGKGMPGHKPFHGAFTVEKVTSGNFELTGPMNRGIVANLGKMAQLRTGNVRVVVVSGRTQANDQAYFRRVGVDPTKMKILVLKSTNHYRADFQPIASEILVVDAPGAIIEDPAKIPYTRIRSGVRK